VRLQGQPLLIPFQAAGGGGRRVLVVVGVITAKTYARAKRTILQPIRTEIFKTQLQELSSVLRLFVGQGEVELRRRFGFHKLLSVNIVLLYDCYARLFFDMEFERDERPYNSRDCPISIALPLTEH
jgi:hypothetical protein